MPSYILADLVYGHLHRRRHHRHFHLRHPLRHPLRLCLHPHPHPQPQSRIRLPLFALVPLFLQFYLSRYMHPFLRLYTIYNSGTYTSAVRLGK
jgi:hypothetical protein